MSGDEGDGPSAGHGGDGLGTGGGRSRFSLPPPPAASFGGEAGAWAPQPQPQPHHRKLPSYVSEPPSAMAAMKAFAQELLAAQGDPDGLLDGPVSGGGVQPPPAATPFDQPDLGGAQQPGGDADTPTVAMAGARSVSPRTAAGLEMEQLPLGVKQAAAAALASKQHFALPSTLPSPKRQSAELEAAARGAAGGSGAAAGGAAATTPLRPHPHLRTSIGKQMWCPVLRRARGRLHHAVLLLAAAAVRPAMIRYRLARSCRCPAGWVCSNSPSSAQETVLEHRVAGDLHVPAATTKQRGRLAMTGGANGGAASPTKDLRRRPMLRASQQSGGGPPSPSPKGTAAQGGQKQGGGGGGLSPTKKAGSDDGRVRRCQGCVAGAGTRGAASVLAPTPSPPWLQALCWAIYRAEQDAGHGT